MEDQKRLKKIDDCWGVGYAKYRRMPGDAERREKVGSRSWRVSSTSHTWVSGR